MIDFDPFERRLAAALRSDADLSVPPFDPASIARAAMQIDHTRQRRVVRMPRRIATMNWSTRFAAAAVIVLIAVAGAFYLLGPGQPTVGTPSPTPGASSNPSQLASPSAVPSPTVVPARAPSWTATGSMARHLQGGIAVLLRDGKVLVIGGMSNIADPAAELYDPRTGTWTATGPMVTPRWQFAAARLLDGRVLVASGAGDPGVLASAELYDPSTDSWTATGSNATARYNATLTLLPDGKVLLAGGDMVTHFFNPSVATAELYDPVTGSWTATGSMGTARSEHTATLLRNGMVLVAGGSNDNDTLSYRLASAELYDPAAGTWTATNDMTQVRSSQTATLLGDGRVLVVGGFGVESSVGSAELYDPTTRSWTLTGSLSTPVMGYTATLLSDGRVLVAGGMDTRPVNASDAPASAAAELYDPSSGTWGATSDLIQARTGHTATLLSDGRVLVAGGISVRGSYDGDVVDRPPGWLASAELCDPGTGR